MFSSAKSFRGQKYSGLRKSCQSTGELFVDPLFPANDTSLFTKGNGQLEKVQWKRPKDICANPRLFVEGTSIDDVAQGRLGNCWLVAATACIAVHKTTWKKIIPNADDQEWHEKNPAKYCGIFRFRFWHHGEWVDVVIDDLLPTVNGKLVYVHSKTDNEFWSALLEKAYAKMFGCYEALDGGGLEEALVDFSGGVAEALDLKAGGYAADEAKRQELFDTLVHEISNKSLMAAAIPATGTDDAESETPEGLIKGHAYSLISVKAAALAGSGLAQLFRKERLPMVKLRNPWGRGEWNGAFSDSSAEWKRIDGSARNRMGLDVEDDGEFWMPFDDFCKHFVNLTVCRLLNTSWLSVDKTWTEGMMRGEWKAPAMSGGCSNNKASYLNNPQLAFSIIKATDDILVSLEQSIEDREAEKKTIGFHLIKVEENRITRLHEGQKIVYSSAYKNSRSVFARIGATARGRYVVLPCTYDPGEEAKFLLRVYTSQAMSCKVLTDDHPYKVSCFGICKASYTLATRIRLVGASGLKKLSEGLYVIFDCEGQQVKSSICTSAKEPTWDSSVLLFRRRKESPIQLKVMHKSTLSDKFLGLCSLSTSDACERKAEQLALKPRKEGDPPVSGTLLLEVTTRLNLDSF